MFVCISDLFEDLLLILIMYSVVYLIHWVVLD